MKENLRRNSFQYSFSVLTKKNVPTETLKKWKFPEKILMKTNENKKHESLVCENICEWKWRKKTNRKIGKWCLKNSKIMKTKNNAWSCIDHRMFQKM
jgi:hypothetical protein